MGMRGLWRRVSFSANPLDHDLEHAWSGNYFESVESLGLTCFLKFWFVLEGFITRCGMHRWRIRVLSEVLARLLAVGL